MPEVQFRHASRIGPPGRPGGSETFWYTLPMCSSSGPPTTPEDLYDKLRELDPTEPGFLANLRDHLAGVVAEHGYDNTIRCFRNMYDDLPAKWSE